jgi:Phytanoyl-CoA dioxygenase (PhyH)
MSLELLYIFMTSIIQFSQLGYYVGKFFDSFDLLEIKDLIYQKLLDNCDSSARYKLERLDDLSGYHQAGLSDDEHNRILSWKNRFVILPDRIQAKFRTPDTMAIFEHFSGNQLFEIKYQKNLHEFHEGPLAGFRVVRPNEEHVAAWHCESSYGLWCYNIWVPIIGYDEHYSLKIIPGSHLTRHPNSEIPNESLARPYTDSYVHSVGCPVRPVFRAGEGILFHPDLLHGGATNSGSKTRVSIEVRLYSAATRSATQRGRRIG